MKKLSVLIIIVFVAFLSCDRRGSVREHLQESISEFNDKQALIETANYYPEYYTEVRTDSIISQTFKVSIKNYSKMNSQILVSSKHENKETVLEYHRVFESEIKVAVASKPIFDTTINARDFNDETQSEFWKNATLEHVWVNQNLSTQKELNLSVSIINPINKTYKLYELVIDTNGQQHLNLIEEHS